MDSAQYDNSSYLMLHNIPTNSCHDHGKHSLSKKVKEMAHSAGKLFHPHDHKPTCNKCGGAKKKKKTETNKKKKKVVKNTEGHWSHWMPNMLDHLKIKKNSEVKNIESGSDSDSDCECESNITRKKVTYF